MISPEILVFSKIANRLRTENPGIFVTGDDTTSPATFPAVVIVEADNSVVQRMRLAAPDIEQAASLLYEVNIYTNRVGYKRLDAKEIMQIIDEEFASMGFTRTLCTPISNLQDASIYRLLARYTGVAMSETEGTDEIIRVYIN